MKIYSKKGVQGENYYIEGSDIEKFRYNPYRKFNREIANARMGTGSIIQAPLHLIIEPTNRCNAKCSFCNREVLTRKIADLPLDWHKKAVDQFAEARGYSISLYALGEPMLHPNILEMCVYAKNAGIPYCDLSTNGSFGLLPLLFTGINEVILSLDGFEKEFNQMRRGLGYDNVVKNLKSALRVKSKFMKQPIIRVQIINNDITKPIMNDFIEYWLKNGADVVYVKEIEAMSQNMGAKNISKEEIEKRIKDRKPCGQLFFGITLDSEGSWSYCCHDPHGKSRIGNIKTMTLKEAWTKVCEIQFMHIKGKQTEFCSRCTDRNW